MSGQPAAPEHPFLARRPYVRPSLNQARIVDLPGVALPDDVRGRLGYELLGAAGLAARLRRQFPALRNAAQPLRAFDAYLAPGHPRQAAALAEAARYGRALGYLLLMLKRGDAVNRVVRRDWGPAHWAFWRGIRCVVVGGGLV
ncbi:MAG: hypothetical protein KC425_06185, partial [Anaerolineales bacterium]|nr:hypothetical protein [Anaerolineales bacterium]